MHVLKLTTNPNVNFRNVCHASRFNLLKPKQVCASYSLRTQNWLRLATGSKSRCGSSDDTEYTVRDKIFMDSGKIKKALKIRETL
jgi:hypothetical protein